jgi:hypothetical protein
VGERHREISSSVPNHGRHRDLPQVEAHGLVNASASGTAPWPAATLPVRDRSRCAWQRGRGRCGLLRMALRSSGYASSSMGRSSRRGPVEGCS